MNNIKCLICNTQIDTRHDHQNQIAKKDKDLLRVYSKLINLDNSLGLSSETILFCTKCKTTIELLSQLYDELNVIQNKIHEAIWKTKITILESIEVEKNESRDAGRDRNFKVFRKLVVQEINPFVQVFKLELANDISLDAIKEEPILIEEDTHEEDIADNIVLPDWQLHTAVNNTEDNQSDPDYSPCNSVNEDNQADSQNVYKRPRMTKKCSPTVNNHRLTFKKKQKTHGKIKRLSKHPPVTITPEEETLNPKFDAEGNPIIRLVRKPEGGMFFGEIEIIDKDEDYYQCGKCGTLYNRLDTMKGHIKSVHLGLYHFGFKPRTKKKGRNKISINSITTFDGKLIFHGVELKKVEGDLNKCGGCGLKYKKRSSLLAHIRSKHMEFDDSDDPADSRDDKEIPELIEKPDGTLIFGGIEITKVGQDRFKCGKCAARVKSIESVKCHIKEIHWRICGYTDKRLSHKKKAKITLNSIKTSDGRFVFHGIELKKNVIEGEKSSWECGKCSTKLTTHYNLLDHIRYYHAKVKKRPTKDPALIYGPKTESETYKDRTVKTDDGRSFFCGVEIIETVDKLLQCSKCNKSLKKRSEILAHIKIHHSEKKPFRCTTCSESYAYKHLLLIHESTHNPSKNYVCEVCGQSFKRPDTLKDHIDRIHRKIINHICSFCGKKFFAKKDFTLHLRTHTKEKS